MGPSLNRARGIPAAIRIVILEDFRSVRVTSSELNECRCVVGLVFRGVVIVPLTRTNRNDLWFWNFHVGVITELSESAVPGRRGCSSRRPPGSATPEGFFVTTNQL